MTEMKKTGSVQTAALRAGMDRKTARKYLKAGTLPSQSKEPRTWRTREDPFDDDWSQVAEMLEHAPELEGKALFEYLLTKQVDRYKPGQLRTFQRRVKQWRVRHGPDKEVFFPQRHRPGEAAQTDFTWCDELGVTIAGEAFSHKLCHVVLPYSGWQSATVCQSESMSALSEGVQTAFFLLGRVPTWHQTDNSTAATHKLSDGKRGFNDDYTALMRHLGMKPRTTAVGEKEQNGSIEAHNGALKRRLRQHLLLRGSRDFDSCDNYQAWVAQALAMANALRADKVAEDLAQMTVLAASRLATYREEKVTVTSWSTIRVKQNTYSVPSRLIGAELKARVFDDRIEAWHGDAHQLTVDRLLGRNNHAINYRHIIASLVRKPGAFRLYRYRDDLFPSLVFRRAYDALTAVRTERRADLEYLRILHLAATEMESDVEVALECLLEDGQVPVSEDVRALVAPKKLEMPDLAAFEPQNGEYDGLLQEVA